MELQRVDFVENALFKSYGVICLPPLPSTLPNELSTDRRNSCGFFSRRRVCTLSDSFCRTTASSLFSMNELLLKLLSLSRLCISCASWPGTCGNAAHCTITYSVHSYGYSSANSTMYHAIC